MNGRLATLAGALLALLIATALLFPRLGPTTPPQSRPASQDIGANGLSALRRWLEVSGTPVQRLHARYTGLSGLPGPAQGNLLIAPDPTVIGVRDSEAKALHDWVAAGNAVLVLGPIPQWAGLSHEPAEPLLKALDLRSTRLDDEPSAICGEYAPVRAAKTKVREKPRDPEEMRDKPPEVITLKTAAPDRAHPLLAGVRTVQVSMPVAALPYSWSYPRPVYDDDGDAERMSFVWLCDTRFLAAALSQFRLGGGKVWVTGYGGLFDNTNLGSADNARLFANLLALSLHGEGAVIFDDMHQGASDLYDPGHFLRDPRLHASVGLLLLIWLVYLLGYDNRFAPARTRVSGVTPAAFARGIGGFYARSLAATEAAQLLLARFHAEVRRRLRTPGSEPVWALLETRPAIDAPALRALREEAQRVDAAAHGGKSYRRDLRPLLHLIHLVKESIR